MPSIKVPFSISPYGGVQTTADTDQIVRQQIIDVLTTSKLERVMRPTYGAGANQLLFEPIDELIYSEFRTDAIPEINKNLSSGYVVDVSIKPMDMPVISDIPETALQITAVYLVRQGLKKTLTFNITNNFNLTEESPL